MKLLFSRGLRNFALIGGESDLYVTNSRLKGYELAFRENYENPSGSIYLDSVTQAQIIRAT